MQKIEGDGLAFVHAEGSICERVLRPGEVIRVDTGCLVAMTQENSVIRRRRLILRYITRAWARLDSISSFQQISGSYGVGIKSGGRKEEGSILGGLGNLLDGDGR
ncbi:biogenesis AIM24 [Paenibacillus sp. yr247]|nr:biogenesis AIM24 [Paenibacillus sp. yr247]